MSERVHLTDQTFGKAVQKAARVLGNGGVILYPTDTLYGLGADAFSDEAVEKVYVIKGRDERKPVHCIVADIAMAEKYADLSNDARLLIGRLTPGPLTLVLKKRPEFVQGIAGRIDTIGIRIPKNDFCLALARQFGRPFTATSANKAGEKSKRNVDAILEQLGAAAGEIDLIVDIGPLPEGPPSTVVDMSGEEPVILREGAIPVADIWNAIRAEP